MKNKVDNQLITRIRKLLSLAKSDNVNEAAAAAETARKLMAEARLSLADIDESEILKDIVEESLYGEKFLENWRWALVTICGHSNCCKVLRIEEQMTFGGVRIIVNLVGNKTDAAGAKTIYEHLESDLLRLCKSSKHPPTHDRLWLEGAVFGVKHAFMEGARKNSTEKALVTTRKISNAVNAYMDKNYRQTVHSAASSVSPPRAGNLDEKVSYVMGFSTGRELAENLKSKDTRKKPTGSSTAS